jgi:hypothetical protein
MTEATDDATAPRPWYRHGHVWLVIAIPASALVAGILTLFIAIHGADPVIPHADAAANRPH